MALRPANGVDLLAAGVGRWAVSERVPAELSDDARVVGAARDGDRAAFGRLYDRYARMVHGLLLARVPPGEVDDLVQDVFVLALRRLSALRESSSFGAWLAAIARNRANDYYRHSPPEEPLSDDEPAHEVSSENCRADARAADILHALKGLPDAYRETLILRLVEGMTGPEIAVRLGMTHGSVRVNLHRGMEQLRAQLRPASRTEEEMP